MKYKCKESLSILGPLQTPTARPCSTGRHCAMCEMQLQTKPATELQVTGRIQGGGQGIRSVITSACLLQVHLQGMAHTMVLEPEIQEEEILLLTSRESLHQVKIFLTLQVTF